MSAGQLVALLVGVPTVLYFAVTTVTLWRGTRRTVRAIRRAGASADPGRVDGVRFVVILPVLREQRIVEATCRRFAALARDHDMEVVVAATAREVPAGPGDDGAPAPEPTTAEVVAKLLPGLNDELGREVFQLVVAPADVAGKVGQMNAALALVEPRPDAATYVAVYDADSSPDPRTFAWVARTVAERRRSGRARPRIFQQVSCYTQNLAAVPGPGGLLALADALAQTRWALGFEYPLYERASRAARTGGLRPLAYCVGHGCIVDHAFLQEVGGFPTLSPNDDLALGYLASWVGAEVCPVPALDLCDVAPGWRSSVRQSRFWFLGSWRFHRDLAAYRRRWPDVPAGQRLAFLVEGHGRNAAWAGRAVLWLTATGAAAVGGPAWLLVVLLSLHVVYVQGGYLHTLWALSRLPGTAGPEGLPALGWARKLLALPLASLTFLLRSAGPLTGLLGAGRSGAPFKVER